MARTATKNLHGNDETSQFQQLQMQQLKQIQQQQQFQNAFTPNQFHQTLHYTPNFHSNAAQNVAAAHSLAVNLVANAAAMNAAASGASLASVSSGNSLPTPTASVDAGNSQAFSGYVLNGSLDCENIGERVKGKRRKYCPHEVTALITGVQRYADDSCPWSSILRDPILGPLFHGRSGVDLKDKWRTLIKTKPELSIYTENRKNHRKYRPFTPVEERALLEGVKRYHGQRNVWSLILSDKDLGPQFNDRTNVQLKDKYRTMKRSGSSPSMFYGTISNRRSGSLSARNSMESMEKGANTTRSTASTRVSSATSSSMAMTQDGNYEATNRPLLNNAQQVANYMLQNNNVSALFADPNLYLGGSLALQPQQLSNLGLHQMAMATSRQQQSAQAQAQAQAHAHAHAQAQAQAHAHAQAQAHAHAQAQAQALAQYQAQLQQQQMRAHQDQTQIKQQPFQQTMNNGNAYQVQSLQGYHLIGNQLVPQQLYYQMPNNARSHQQQQRQYQQQQYLQHQQIQMNQVQSQRSSRSDAPNARNSNTLNPSNLNSESLEANSLPPNWTNGPVSPPMESLLAAQMNGSTTNENVKKSNANETQLDPIHDTMNTKSEVKTSTGEHTSNSNDKSLIPYKV
ncbi:hypothetical protein ABG067_004827 [Albugo candida]